MKKGSIIWLLFWTNVVLGQTTFTPISNLNQPTSGNTGVLTNQTVANSFTTFNTLTALSTVSVRMAATVAPPGSSFGPFTLALYDDANGAPGNRMETFSGNDYPTNGAVYTYTNARAFILMSNTVYWIVGSTSNSTGHAAYHWDLTSSASLDSGSIWSLGPYEASVNGGAWKIYSTGYYLEFAVTVTTNLPETPLISVLPTASSIAYGQSLASSTLAGGVATNSTGALVPGTFYFYMPWRIPEAGTSDETVVFTPADSTHYVTATGSVPVTVGQPVPWTETTAPYTNWTSIAMSADGLRMVAVSSGSGNLGPVYSSSDSGETWTQQTSAPAKSWESVACSADGNELVMSANATIGQPIGVSISTNAGVTWYTNDLPKENWYAVAVSADGSRLMAASSHIYTSTNYGATWRSNSIVGAFGACASSAAGTTLVAGGISGPISISTNSGATWAQMLSSGAWWSFATSADGSKVAAVGLGGTLNTNIFISRNYGVNWTTNKISSQTSQYIASSVDGNQLVLAVKGGGIYTSPNGGISWGSNSAPTNQWCAVASSADGSVLAAAVQGGGIWTLKLPVNRTLGCWSSDATNLAISWLVPATNVVLKQSSDLHNWYPVTNNPTLNLTNLHHQLVLPILGTNEFFKLATP